MAESEDEQFIKQRAELLTVLTFSRKHQLRVLYTSRQGWPGADLIFILKRGTEISTHTLGVNVRAAVLTEGQPLPSGDLSRDETDLYRDAYYPLCMVLFVMNDDKGYFRWIQAPHPTRPGYFKFYPSGDWVALDESQIDIIIAQVEDWYSARRQQSMEDIGEMAGSVR